MQLWLQDTALRRHEESELAGQSSSAAKEVECSNPAFGNVQHEEAFVSGLPAICIDSKKGLAERSLKEERLSASLPLCLQLSKLTDGDGCPFRNKRLPLKVPLCVQETTDTNSGN